MAGVSAWRVNDVVAYDATRDAATTLTALLLQVARRDASQYGSAGVEIAHLRRDVVAVDGYDRAAVAELARHIAIRVAELSGEPS